MCWPAIPSANAQPSGGTPRGSGGGASGIECERGRFGRGSGGCFSAGDMLAVDADYQQQTGYVGSGIAAAYVNDPGDVNHDPNYVRRVTFNLGRVAEKTVTSLLLAQPLLGGAPVAGAGAQKVVAFVDREGGSFFQEWSACSWRRKSREDGFAPLSAPESMADRTSRAEPPDFSGSRKWKY